MDKIEKKKEKRKKKRRNERGEREKNEEGIFCFFLRFIEIGLSVFIGARSKFYLRDESFMWVPNSWSFVKLQEVENFPTLIIFSLKVI